MANSAGKETKGQYLVAKELKEKAPKNLDNQFEVEKFIQKAYELTGDSSLLDNNRTLSEKYNIAHTKINEIITHEIDSSKLQTGVYETLENLIDKKDKPATTKQTAQSLQAILINPEAYGLKPQEAQAVAAGFTFYLTKDPLTNPDVPEGLVKEALETQRNEAVNSYLNAFQESELNNPVPIEYSDFARSINQLAATDPKNSQALTTRVETLNTTFSNAQSNYAQTIRNPQAQAASTPSPSIANSALGKITQSAAFNKIANRFGGVLGKSASTIADALNSRDAKSILKAGALVAGFALGGPLGLGVVLLLTSKRFYQLMFLLMMMVITTIAIEILTIITVSTLIISLVLIIVRNSAYIVPPSDLGAPRQAGYTYSSSGGDIGPGGDYLDPGLPSGFSCPVPNGVIICGVYGSSVSACGHGDNNYWSALGACSWGLPSTNWECYKNQIPGSVCYAQPVSYDPPGSWTGKACPYYGLSADISYPGYSAGAVYFPYINGESVTWTGGGFDCTDCGCGSIVSATHSGTKYTMYLMHLNQYTAGGASGSRAGFMYYSSGCGTPHLHLELRVDGQFTNPEALCI